MNNLILHRGIMFIGENNKYIFFKAFFFLSLFTGKRKMKEE